MALTSLAETLGKIANVLNGQPEVVEEFRRQGREQLFADITALLAKGASYVWDFMVFVTPDVVGYLTLASAVLMILSPMIGKGLAKPLGLFAASAIIGICIRGV